VDELITFLNEYITKKNENDNEFILIEKIFNDKFFDTFK